MLTTARTIAGLEKLIAAEKERLANFDTSAPNEEKVAINVLIAASRKLSRQLDFVDSLGPNWLERRQSILNQHTSKNRSATGRKGTDV